MGRKPQTALANASAVCGWKQSLNYKVTFALADDPSEKFTWTLNVAPGVNRPIGKLPLMKSAANTLKLAPAVNGKFTVPFTAFSNAVSRPLAAPITQN